MVLQDRGRSQITRAYPVRRTVLPLIQPCRVQEMWRPKEIAGAGLAQNAFAFDEEIHVRPLQETRISNKMMDGTIFWENVDFQSKGQRGAPLQSTRSSMKFMGALSRNIRRRGENTNDGALKTYRPLMGLNGEAIVK